MSSLAEKLNQKRNRTLGVETKGFTYVKLADLFNENGAETVYPVLGAYQHKGQFGLESVLIITGKFVNLPKHLNDDVREIMNNPEIVQEKKLGFKIVPYKSKYGKFFTVEWIDM